METKDTCFCEECLIDRSFLVLKILRMPPLPPPPPPMAAQAKKVHGE